MSDLPDEFPCELVTWDYVYDRSYAVGQSVREADWRPDTVVALARGGWFAGRVLCDVLGIDDLVSLKMEHYVGTAQQADEPQVRYELPEGAVAGKDVLIVDDIADTGGSIQHAREYVTSRDPRSVQTATVWLLETSDVQPDYVGEQLDSWAWIVFPWNFIEDMIDLTVGVMEKSDQSVFTESELRSLLDRYHDISHFELETIQRGRFGEVLAEMDRRGHVESTGAGYQLL